MDWAVLREDACLLLSTFFFFFLTFFYSLYQLYRYTDAPWMQHSLEAVQVSCGSWSDWLKQPLTKIQKYILHIIGATLITVYFDTFKNANKENFLSLNHSLQSILTAPGERCQEWFLHTPMQYYTQACVVLGPLPVIIWSHSGVCKGEWVYKWLWSHTSVMSQPSSQNLSLSFTHSRNVSEWVWGGLCMLFLWYVCVPFVLCVCLCET